MEEGITFFEVIRAVLLWLSPLILLEGVLLLLVKKDKLTKIEEELGKEVGGIRKRIVPSIETNIFSFQNWMVKKTPVLGIFFIVYSIVLFIFLSK
ncbi:MAG: hypothetical protein WC301_06310 [Candidatus Omnitrophota bacterium]|jgi:preprotein translocase subunit SecG